MNATLVGADRLGNIPALLESQGIRVLCHISGRAASAQRRTGALPKGTQLLILFTDFLGHNVMRTFRQAAQEEGVPVLACRRSASCLMQSLERRGSATSPSVSVSARPANRMSLDRRLAWVTVRNKSAYLSVSCC